MANTVLFSPSSSSPSSWALKRGLGLRRVPRCPNSLGRALRRSFVAAAANSPGFANENRDDGFGFGFGFGLVCNVQAVAPYERPALTKGYLFPPDKKPARLPGFHTCVGSGGERQTPEWYTEHGIEVLYQDPVVAFDGQKQTVTTTSGKILKYGSLIVSTGCEAARFPEKIGGNLPGVHYIRDVADADSLVSSLGRAKKVAVIGGGYIGMEVAAAAAGWNLDTTIIFPEDHIMPRLFTPSLARRYEELYQQNGVKFMKGVLIDKLEAGAGGRVANVILKNGSVIEADTVVVGIGAKPVVSPFEAVGLNNSVGGIQVDSHFRTSLPGVFAVGDVAAFPLKIYNRTARVEHVDHARKSAQHFGETIEVGNFDPKVATFWIDSDSRLKGVFLESGSSEEVSLLPQLAKAQSLVDKAKLKSASSIEDALEIARSSLKAGSAV
ncbi:Monodehydroascorbate reductase, chloroplastic [Ananas comosus]|uniref:monodehydroascorbate reductase (NADH) n=1 Tax=Ananas comosus TaxID=4615 RepID=A0A199VP65_ANACO|nr:Monodehydroascorbate reductase, chloroplastic [Ananas comosus]